MTQPTTIAAALAALLAALLLASAVLASKRRHPWAGGLGTLLGLLLLSLSGLFATLSVSIQGYRGLTHEELAAVVRTRPTGLQSFEVELRLPDGVTRRYVLAGDELYVDARILKWHPWVNLLGLHTAYALDRLAGRYTELDDEINRPRTLFSLAEDRPVDAFALRRRHAWLAPLVDASYGSATFIAADHPAEYEVRVSTTGLLVRETP
jgi:hypothetical protein